MSDFIRTVSENLGLIAGVGVGGLVVTIILFKLMRSSTDAQRRAKAEKTAEAIATEHRYKKLADSLRQANEDRDELMLLTTTFPGFTKRFSRVTRMEDLGEVILTALHRAFNCKRALVLLRAKDGLKVAGSRGMTRPEKIPDIIRDGDGRAGWAAKIKVSMMSADFNKLSALDQNRVRQTEKIEEKFDAYSPMVFDGETLGVICASSPRMTVSYMKSMLITLTNIAGLAVVNLRRNARIKYLSEIDAGTGLLNRRSFSERFQAALAEGPGKPVSLLLLDIDHFKKFNDTYGHLVGDEVLRHVASISRAATRDGELAARWGGEEFIVLFRSSREDVIARAQALARRIRETPLNTPEFGDLAVTVSGGIAFRPLDARNAKDMIQRADERLYAAKDAGRDRIIHAGNFSTAPKIAASTAEKTAPAKVTRVQRGTRVGRADSPEAPPVAGSADRTSLRQRTAQASEPAAEMEATAAAESAPETTPPTEEATAIASEAPQGSQAPPAPAAIVEPDPKTTTVAASKPRTAKKKAKKTTRKKAAKPRATVRKQRPARTPKKADG